MPTPIRIRSYRLKVAEQLRGLARKYHGQCSDDGTSQKPKVCLDVERRDRSWTVNGSQAMIVSETLLARPTWRIFRIRGLIAKMEPLAQELD